MFTKAITKKPCKALINGISTAQFGEARLSMRKLSSSTINMWKRSEASDLK